MASLAAILSPLGYRSRARRLALTLCLAAASCAPQPEPRGLAEGRNVVVIVIDTLRADHLPFYGYHKPTAPFMSALADESVVFDAAYAASTWTAPSTATLFTSLYPKDHGVWTGLRTFKSVDELGVEVELNRMPPATRTLPEWMASWGYRTYGFADNPNIDTAMGFTRGFDHFTTWRNQGATRIHDEVLALKDELLEGSRPYFLYLHFMDPHMPYERKDSGYDLESTVAPERYREDMARYDSEILHVDTQIADLFRELGLARDALVVITSDHGEEFGDHGLGAHGAQLHNELLRVPLLFHGADEAGRSLFEPKRVAEPVCLIDVLPTLRGLLGAPAEATDRGLDLTDRLTGSAEEARRLLFPERPMELEILPFEVRAVIDGQLKYYRDTRLDGASLFDMASDPSEFRDLSAKQPDEAERLEAALQEHLDQPALFERSYASREALDAQLAEQLRRLGYVGD